MTTSRAAFLVIAGLLLLFLMLFPILTIDAIARLIARRSDLDAANFALLLFLETSRAFTTVVAVVAATALLVRSSHRPDGRALTFFLIFLALTVEKLFGATGFPGLLQERLTTWLLGAGIPRAALTWLFGPLAWPVWPALAALLRFSVVFPQPLTAETIDAVAPGDRRGMLRGSAFAGQDIGAGFREVSKRGLAAGAWEPRPLWTGAFVLIVVTTILNSAAGIMLIAAGAMVVTALVITNLRASYRVVLPEEKKAIRWLWLGFMTAAILFAAGAAPLLFMDSVAATVTALVLLTLGPAAAMICMAMAVTRAAR